MENDICIRVIGFGPATAPAIEKVQNFGFEGLAAEKALGSTAALADNNAMALLLTDGLQSGLGETIADCRRRGILCLVLSTADIDCDADSLAVVAAEDMAEGVKTLVDPVLRPGYINIDFRDLTNYLTGGGHFCYYSATGTDREYPVRETVDRIKGQLSESLLSQPHGVLLNLYYNSQSQFSASQIKYMSHFIEVFHPDSDVIWGLAYDDSLPVGTARMSAIVK